jgi:hypothetical protein
MAGWTNRGKLRTLNFLGGTNTPATFRVFLLTPATAPTAGTNTISAVTQVNQGNGYNTDGMTIALNTTDFDTFTEQDGSTNAFAQLRDLVWTAAGGAIPNGGSGARYAALGNYTSTLASTEIWYWWDLTSERTVSNGQTLTLQNCQIQIDES